jgi:hypothetical protein
MDYKRNRSGFYVRDASDGEKYPSVSTVISDIYAKDERFWRWKLGYPYAKQVTNKAVKRGNRLHHNMHNLATKRKTRFPAASRELREKSEQFFSDKKIILSERGMVSPRGFGGSPDVVYTTLTRAVGSTTGNVLCFEETTLLDYKTGKFRLENLLQLGGYRVLCQDNGINIDYNIIVFLKGNNFTVMSELVNDDFSPQFLALLELYKWKQRRLGR